MLIPLLYNVQPPAVTPPAIVVKIGTPYIAERLTTQPAPTAAPRPQSRTAVKPSGRR